MLNFERTLDSEGSATSYALASFPNMIEHLFAGRRVRHFSDMVVNLWPIEEAWSWNSAPAANASAMDKDSPNEPVMKPPAMNTAAKPLPTMSPPTPNADGEDVAQKIEGLQNVEDALTNQEQLKRRQAQLVEELGTVSISIDGADDLLPPVKFIDAVGRVFCFPWNHCKSWKVRRQHSLGRLTS